MPNLPVTFTEKLDPDLRWIILIYARMYTRVMVGPMDAARVSSYRIHEFHRGIGGTNNSAGRVATGFIANSFYTLFPMKRSLHEGIQVHPIARGKSN